MRYNISDKLIAYLALISGLSISAVAIYYSVAGLMAIFAAAVIPIMIMGIVLEVGKLSATVWLKQNWSRAPRFLKTYLLLAIASLMLLTSMGIFGYLSKAHLDQAIPTGDVAAKVAILDEKIKTEKDNIETARVALKQMDAQVDARLSRSDDEKGAERAVQIRRQQQTERTRLQKEIGDAQARIAKLNEERAPVASELRKVEAEVGPIKYIAALIYGDQADQNLLEKAVRWVIIVIVLVFDPLAVILLLASQYSFSWFRQEQEDNPQEEKQTEVEPDQSEEKEDDFKFLAEEKDLYPEDTKTSLWPFPSPIGKMDTLPEAEQKHVESIDPVQEVANVEEPEVPLTTPSEVEQWNKMIEEAEKAVVEEKEKEDHEIIESAPENEKEAMAAWKHDHPDSSLKLQRRLYEKGAIDKLPWEDYLKPKADFSDDEAAAEAAKWAMEQLEKKKDDATPIEEISWMEHDEQGNQIKKTKEGYTQNAEQSERTIWQRIQDAKK